MRPRLSYFVCATPRSGSYLLCDLLKATGVAGAPTEYVSVTYENHWMPIWKTATYRDYLDRVIQTGMTRNRVFGLKAHIHQFRHFQQRLRSIPEYNAIPLHRIFAEAFGDVRHIWITRRDKVRQAVSYLIATQSNMWWDAHEAPAPAGTPTPERVRFDYAAVARFVQKTLDEERLWLQYFDRFGIEPLVVVYEDLVAAQTSVLTGVLKHLRIPWPGLDRHTLSPQIRKQSDDRSEGWVARYHRLNNISHSKSLAGFTDLHVAEKIVVCGLGESLNELKSPADYVTIGVNDIGRVFTPNYLVVVDNKKRLGLERYAHILKSKADCLFAVNDIDTGDHPFVVRFPLRKHTWADLCDVNYLDYLSRPWYSPYIALELAAIMGARRIGMIGVDFADNHAFATTGPYPGDRHIAKVDADFRTLNGTLTEWGVKVFNLSFRSHLTAFPRLALDDFARLPQFATIDARPPLRIVVYRSGSIDATTAALTHCINAYTGNYARSIVTGPNSERAGRFETDIYAVAEPAAAEAEMRKADVVVLMDGVVETQHAALLANKPSLVIKRDAKGLLRVAGTEAILPYPIALYEHTLSPDDKAQPAVFCVPAEDTSSTSAHVSAVNRLVRTCRTSGVALIGLGAQNRDEVLAAMRAALVVVDDCSGRLARSSLEALATGCVVVNGLASCGTSHAAFNGCAPMNAPSPFAYATPDTLERTIEALFARGPQALVEAGRRNRQWMFDNWLFDQQWSQHWMPAISHAFACNAVAV
jgi:LPS sulfotransferase NodH